MNDNSSERDPFDAARFQADLEREINSGVEETLHLYTDDETPGASDEQGTHNSATDERRIVRTAPVSGPIKVMISNRNGDIAIEAVEGLTEARAELRSRSAVDLAPFAPQFRDGELWIEVPQLVDSEGTPAFSMSFGKRSFSWGNHKPEVIVALRVPADSSVLVEGGERTGDVSLRGRYRHVDLKTGHGDISLDEAQTATCNTGSGDISIRRVNGDLVANTGSGDISVSSNGGEVKAATGSGDISVASVTGQGKLSTGSGDIQLTTLQGQVKLSSGSGDFSVREVVSGAVQAQTASGDISIGVRSGTPVWTDVNTLTGDVNSSLRGAGQPAEGEPYIEIKATTVSGDISLVEA